MGNTDKFDMIATIYDTPERAQIAKVSSDAIREYIVDAKNKNAISVLKRNRSYFGMLIGVACGVKQLKIKCGNLENCQ